MKFVIYSVSVPSAFIANLFKGQVQFSSLELVVKAAFLVSLEATKHCKVSTKR